ncbi:MULTISPECIES: hypothetical protein [Vibrio]|nr:MULTISPECIES: hypothetical protein [Vibrio]
MFNMDRLVGFAAALSGLLFGLDIGLSESDLHTPPLNQTVVNS